MSSYLENNAFSVRQQPRSISQFYMLRLHRDRMLAAAEAFDWPTAVQVLQDDKGLRRMEEVLKLGMSGLGHGLECCRVAKVSTGDQSWHWTWTSS